MKKHLALPLAMVCLTACASVKIPPERLEHSEASIRSAEEVGATNVPTAKLHLQLAKDQTVTAKKMAENGDERAVLVLARAEADSELALALAREAQMHSDAVKAAEDLKAVQSRGTP